MISVYVKADPEPESSLTYNWYWEDEYGEKVSSESSNSGSYGVSGTELLNNMWSDNTGLLKCDVYADEEKVGTQIFNVHLDTGLYVDAGDYDYSEDDDDLENSICYFHVDKDWFGNSLSVYADFKYDGIPDRTVTYEWYDPDGSIVGDNSSTLNNVDLSKGQYWWGCTVSDAYGNSYTAEFIIENVIQFREKTYKKFAPADGTITLNPADDQYVDESESDSYEYFWRVGDSEDTVSKSKSYDFKLNPGDESADVYCDIYNEEGSSVTITYIVKNTDKLKENALPLTLGGAPVQVSLGKGETQMLSFTAPASGRYEFDANSGDDTCAKLFDSEMQYVDEYDDPRGDDTGLDFGFSRDLVQGQTCYLVVRFYDKDTEGDFTVSVKKHTHRWIADEDNYPATCGKDGYSLFICATCDDASETHPKATGRHTWVWSTVRNATALQAGLRTAKCKVCGGTTNAAIPKLTPTVTLNAYSVPLKVKQRSQVITASGFAAGDYVRSWTSSNSKVVKATPAGNSVVLKAGKKPGKAVITVTLASGKTAQLTVKVQKKKVTTKRINIKTAKKLTLTRGSKVSIGASVTPITSPEKLKYKSSKKKVASVSKQGVITAKKKGKAVITVQSGKKKIKIQVTVK